MPPKRFISKMFKIKNNSLENSQIFSAGSLFRVMSLVLAKRFYSLLMALTQPYLNGNTNGLYFYFDFKQNPSNH